MPLQPGSQVWVKDEEGRWNPAKVCHPREYDASFLSSLYPPGVEPLCVRMYHSKDDVFPVMDTESVKAIDWSRPADQAIYFDSASSRLIDIAKKDHDEPKQREPSPPAAPPAASPVPAAASPTGGSATFNAAEQANIREYLKTIQDPEALADAKAALELMQEEGAQIEELRATVNAKENEFGHPAPAAPPPAAATHVASKHRNETPEERKARRDAKKARIREREERRERREEARLAAQENDDGGHREEPTEEDLPQSRARTEERPELQWQRSIGVDSLDPEELEQRLFNVDEDAFVLNPTSRVVQVLGGLYVKGRSMHTRVSFPEKPPHRKITADTHAILAVACGEPPGYDKSSGWMEGLDLGTSLLVMSVCVEDTRFEVPDNWQLHGSAHGRDVFRTLIPLDVSAPIFECSAWARATPGQEIDPISLAVEFSLHDSELALWRGVVALVLVELVDVATVANNIAQLYRPINALYRREADFAQIDTSIRCPLGGSTLKLPCRSKNCEHFQCMELENVLASCSRMHVWNCPICRCVMPLESIVVDMPQQRAIEKIARPTGDEMLQIELDAEGTPTVTLKHDESRRETRRLTEEIVDIISDSD